MNCPSVFARASLSATFTGIGKACSASTLIWSLPAIVLPAELPLWSKITKKRKFYAIIPFVRFYPRMLSQICELSTHQHLTIQDQKLSTLYIIETLADPGVWVTDNMLVLNPPCLCDRGVPRICGVDWSNDVRGMGGVYLNQMYDILEHCCCNSTSSRQRQFKIYSVWQQSVCTSTTLLLHAVHCASLLQPCLQENSVNPKRQSQTSNMDDSLSNVVSLSSSHTLRIASLHSLLSQLIGWLHLVVGSRDFDCCRTDNLDMRFLTHHTLHMHAIAEEPTILLKSS